VTRIIAGSLVACVLIGAIGGFGAPLLCQGSRDDKCPENWRGAAAGAVAASGTLSALLARITGTSDRQP